MKFIAIWIVIIILRQKIEALGQDCVVFNFENPVSEILENGIECSSYYSEPWQQGSYQIIEIEPPEEKSTQFITPETNGCGRTIQNIRVHNGGILECRVYLEMRSIESNGLVRMVLQDSDNDRIIGEEMINSETYADGWHTIRMNVLEDIENACILLIGNVSPSSILLAEYIRYVENSERLESCSIYNDVEDSLSEEQASIESIPESQTNEDSSDEFQSESQTNEEPSDETEPESQTDEDYSDEIEPESQTNEEPSGETEPESQTDEDYSDEIEPESQTNEEPSNEIEPESQTDEEVSKEIEPESQTNEESSDEVEPENQPEEETSEEDLNPDTGEETEPESQEQGSEESFESPIIIDPVEESFWNPWTITGVAVLSAFVFLGFGMLFYKLGKRRARKQMPPFTPIYFDDLEVPKSIVVPRVHNVYSPHPNHYYGEKQQHFRS